MSEGEYTYNDWLLEDGAWHHVAVLHLENHPHQLLINGEEIKLSALSAPRIGVKSPQERSDKDSQQEPGPPTGGGAQKSPLLSDEEVYKMQARWAWDNGPDAGMRIRDFYEQHIKDGDLIHREAAHALVQAEFEAWQKRIGESGDEWGRAYASGAKEAMMWLYTRITNYTAPK